MIISSIDLMGGKVVQLEQGKKKLLERNDPFTLARTFDRYGETAVIDLDAAMGKKESVNTPIIHSLLKRTECRVGGGIDSVEKAKELISRGAKKIIIGSKAFQHDRINHSFLETLTDTVGRFRIIIAVDALRGEIVTEGWKHCTGLPLLQTIGDIEP